MAIIRVLDKSTSNKIAAGEVVERPASVVKEFVENALDAGATSITVEAREGGISSIKVTDNGCGIDSDQLKTAFLRHATSKITSSDDLSRIETLGFRGEALSSIAAVSRVTVRTKTAGALTGALLRIQGGEITEFTETGAPDGTSIEANDLFFNVPARLKFMKSARTEAAYINDYMLRMIIARPDVAFTVTQNDKTVYRSPGDGELINALFCVYGADVTPNLRALDYDDGYVAVSGYVGTEALGRANRTAQSFYVNKRYIKSQKLSFALQRAYDTRLMTGRFPFCAIMLSINSAEIDVNVHPNKLDVRFRQEERIERAVYGCVRAALNTMQTPFNANVPSARDDKPVADAPSRVSIPSGGPLRLEALSREAFAARPVEGLRLCDSGAEPKPETSQAAPVRPYTKEYNETPTFTEMQPDGRIPVQQEMTGDAFFSASCRFIGQLFGCYWVVQREDNVFFIDQHAAHERRLYETILKRGVNTDSQLLMIPETVRLSPAEFSTLMDNIKAFEELGFDIAEFGPFTISVRAVPSILGAPQTTAFLLEAVEQLSAKYRLNTMELKRGALIRAACHHAIKAGEQPDRLEMAELLDCYEREGVPLTCPHGRPVMVCVSRLEFEKLFKRVL